MIEASFAMQYPQKDLFKLDDEDMCWQEFTTLLAGLMPDTPLGQIISIRSEEDDDTLKNFTQEQHRIRNDWKNRQVQQMINEMSEEEVMQQVKQMFTSLCA